MPDTECQRLREALRQAMTEADIYRGLLIYGKPWEPKYQESWQIMQREASAALVHAVCLENQP